MMKYKYINTAHYSKQIKIHLKIYNLVQCFNSQMVVDKELVYLMNKTLMIKVV